MHSLPALQTLHSQMIYNAQPTCSSNITQPGDLKCTAYLLFKYYTARGFIMHSLPALQTLHSQGI